MIQCSKAKCSAVSAAVLLFLSTCVKFKHFLLYHTMKVVDFRRTVKKILNKSLFFQIKTIYLKYGIHKQQSTNAEDHDCNTLSEFLKQKKTVQLQSAFVSITWNPRKVCHLNLPKDLFSSQSWWEWGVRFRTLANMLHSYLGFALQKYLWTNCRLPRRSSLLHLSYKDLVY